MESDVVQLPLSHKLWAWFEINQKRVVYGAIGVVALGIIIGFSLWRSNEKQIAAGNALSSVAISQLTSGGSRPDLAKAYLQVAADYPGSQAAAQAVLLAAGNLYSEGKFADAQVQFEKFVREYNDSPFMTEALLGVASSLNAQGKINEAIAAYKNLIDHHPGQSVIPQAKFELARLYQAQDKPELAYNLYEEVARTDYYGSLGSEAGVRAEELKVKYPSLAPAPAPAPAFTLPSATPTVVPPTAPAKDQKK